MNSKNFFIPSPYYLGQISLALALAPALALARKLKGVFGQGQGFSKSLKNYTPDHTTFCPEMEIFFPHIAE